MDTLQGHLLVAAPHQLDPNFARTTALVVQHTDRGAFGLIVNCRERERPGLFWQRAPKRRRLVGRRRPYFGGPVAGPLMAVHTDPFLAEIEILPDVFFTANEKHILTLVRQLQQPYKVFAGYVGWGAQQLDLEVAQGIWRSMPATADYVFSARTDLWDELSRQIFELVLHSVFHIKHIPQDPLLN
ncbi:MAG: YqgE/AlgH family protein [Thermoguttaceae bacterium]|jgi:putative transcriptional regulator